MAPCKRIYEKVTIYGLYDPRTNALRYVGQTVQPLPKRLSLHVTKARSPRYLKDQWIRDLMEMGLLPQMKAIRVVLFCEADDAEKESIREMREAGCDLFNVKDINARLPEVEGVRGRDMSRVAMKAEREHFKTLLYNTRPPKSRQRPKQRPHTAEQLLEMARENAKRQQASA
jgi:hypothetical protein